MEINNRQDFLIFFRKFIEEMGAENFEKNTLDGFLKAMESWIGDMDGYYKNIGQEKYCHDEILDWCMLADMLNAARIYE